MPAQDLSIGSAGLSGTSEPERALTWSDARQLAFDCVGPLESVSQPLTHAIGCQLAVDVTAGKDIPHYATSAMDGWAINGSGPWMLMDLDSNSSGALDEGQARTIATGGLVPNGATAVVRKESGIVKECSAGTRQLTLKSDAKFGETIPGRHIRPAGEEAAAGDLLIPAGTVLNPAHIALAAVAGKDELQVHRKPMTAVVLTGSEVVSTGEAAPGQVRDTLGPQLGVVISQLGGVPGYQLRIGDSYDAWLSALACSRDGQRPDVLITTGGTGKSGTDHFRAAIAALGGSLLIDGIAMRPGHPVMLAKLPAGGFIIGLPGNPLAAMLSLMTIGEPLLAALAGLPLRNLDLVASGSVIESTPGQTRLVPCTVVNRAAIPTTHVGPAMMRGLASADGFIAVPPGGVESGQIVPMMPFPWTPLWNPSFPKLPQS